MKKFSEKEIRRLEMLSTVTALLLAVLCVVYLFDILRNGWMLNLLLALGMLLHVFLMLCSRARQNYWKMETAGFLALACAAALAWFVLTG